MKLKEHIDENFKPKSWLFRTVESEKYFFIGIFLLTILLIAVFLNSFKTINITSGLTVLFSYLLILILSVVIRFTWTKIALIKIVTSDKFLQIHFLDKNIPKSLKLPWKDLVIEEDSKFLFRGESSVLKIKITDQTIFKYTAGTNTELEINQTRQLISNLQELQKAYR